MHKGTIIKSALILTLANVITRVLGFVYRVYMSKAIGAEGMGLYQIITPLYLLIWAISSSGLSTTMSKLTAQEKARGQNGNVERILTLSLIISISLATILSVLVHTFAKEISIYIIKDSRTTLSLKWLSPCFPFMAAGSVLRGYFLGSQEAKIPAISQVIEQLVRMATVYFLASTMIPMGLEYACGAAILGMALGEIIAFLFVALNWYISTRKTKPKVPIITRYQALTLIVAMALPLTFNRVVGSIYSTIENILLPQRLQVYGMTQSQALSELGRLCGMAMPLVMFPSSLLTALATAVLPVVAECYTLKQYNRIASTLKQSLLLTAIVACGASGLFLSFGYEIGSLIYSEKEIGYFLKLIGVICPFTYLQVTLAGVLNGLGEQLFIFKINLIASVLNIISIYFLVPIYSLNGFIFIWLVTSIIVSAITINRIKARINANFKVITQFLKPTLAIIFACSIGGICNKYILIQKSNINTIILLIIIGSIYTLLLFQLRCIKKEDFPTYK